MNFKHLFGIFCIMLCFMPMAFAGNLMVLHGKAYDGNLLMTTGDVRIQLYTAQSGGSLIYDSVGDFTGAIKNGLFDVLLGSGIPLDVNYGQYYYYALQINGKDINFGTSLRQVFQSSHGDLNIYPISQLINDKGYLVPSALTPYLTKVDANGFYAFKTDVNLWTNQLLVPYLSKVDANGFYALKSDVNIWTQQLLVPYTTKTDTNIWIVQKLAPYLLQTDANGFFAFKSDVNLWANQLLVPYLLKTDANGFYAFKTDVNLWTNQLLVPYLLKVDANGFYYNKSDVNASFLSKVDANGFYPLKADVNVWIDQKLANFPTVDTNWQTSWTVFDANMKATYTKIGDTNVWINQKLVPYLLQVDANGFYAYKTDVNLWGDQRYMPINTTFIDTNWQTSFGVFDANMKATYTKLLDTNIWINQKLVPYLLQVDANGFYAYKVDVNLWGDQRYISLSQNVLTSEPTGFTSPANVIIDYNRISRTIKLTGSVTAYWDGNLVPALISGWVSPVHPATLGAWYLYYNGTNFVWSQTAWTFNMLQIAFVYYDTNEALDTFGVRESHGMMQWQVHKELHQTIGTYLSAGGDLNGYVLGSTTATDRRPTVSSTTINDEDLQTTNPDLNNALYTKYYVTGANATSVFTENTAEFILVNGNIPYYNQFTGGAWQLTAMPNNNYQAIWLIAIPTTSDTNSQKYRYVWVMGQSISPTLSTIQAITPTSLNLGQISNFTNEFVFIDRVIIQLSGGGGGNWNIVQIDKLTGTKLTQVASPAGNYLSTVATDDTLTGNGTAINPLHVVLTDTNWQTSWNVFDANMRYYFALKSDVNLWTNQLLVPYLTKLDANGFYAYKTDVNLWGDQRYLPINTFIPTDTNWQTSWSVFDANMRYYFALNSDVNVWTNQLLVPYLTKLDANGFYALKSDVNIWAAQLDTVQQLDANMWYLLKTDANQFYAFKTDVNLWGDQRYLPINTVLMTDTNWQTSWNVFDANMRYYFALNTDVNAWTNQLLVPYLTKTDANGFYTLKTDTNVWIDQKLVPYLLQVDANGFFTLKTDTNVWIDQRLVPYLLKTDANAFYAYKTDVNLWGDQRYIPIGAPGFIDTNWQTSWAVFDANMRYYFALTTDVNTWGDQRYLPINTVLPLDTNWQTSWVVFDANMRFYFALKSDVNIWTNQLLIPYLTKVDANGFYAFKTDVNTWASQLDARREIDYNQWYLLKTDANGFYTLKTDTNVWANQLIFVTQADSNKWTLTKLDANGFYALKTDVNVWTNQLLVPYLTKVDANGFYTLKADTNIWASQLIFVAQQDSNKWTLTKLDANALYALKTDVNVWTQQLLVPYLTKADANGFFTLKTDTNVWANQLIIAAQTDSNKWALTKVDGNALYALKADVNVWTNQLLVPYLLKSDANIWTNQLILSAQADSNNWVLTKLDANALYALKSDVNIWTNQLLVPYLTKVDANGFYPLKTDINIWTNQLLVPYLLKTDANGFYTLKTDTNVWANQLIFVTQADSNKWTLTKLDANGFYALKTDVNVWANQLLVPYLTKVDANGFYVLKTDLNSDINAVIALYNYYSKADINASFLNKIDANGFYVLKTDLNNKGPWVVSGNNIYNNTSGNVGIGTTSPSQLLQVGPTIPTGVTPYTLLNGLRISGGDTSNTIWQSTANTNLNITVNSTANTSFVGLGAASSPGMVVTGAGNVGIGTTTPNAKLTVAGDANIGGALTTTGAINAGGNLVLGANTLTTSNTGLVSNLNADMVDGTQLDNIVYGSYKGTFVSTVSDYNTMDRTGVYTGTGIINRPTGTTWTYLQNMRLYSVDNTYHKQIAYDTYNNNMWTRTNSGNVWSQWYKLWNEYNDGSGSNLDADLLDGHETSYFQTALTNPVVGTGTINYISKFTTAGTVGNSQIFDNGTNVGIGTTTPQNKLNVIGDVNATSFKTGDGNMWWDGSNLHIGQSSGILYVDKNISSSGYITRTVVYDKSQGTALSKIFDANYYIISATRDINHTAYGYSAVDYNINVFDKMITIKKDENVIDKTIIHYWDLNGKELDEKTALELKIDEYTTTTEHTYKIIQVDVNIPVYKTVQETGVSLDKEVALIKQALFELKTCITGSKDFVQAILCAGK